MPVARTHPPLAALAFAGIALLVGFNSSPAAAATTPLARAEAQRGCVATQPRFVPKAARPAMAETAAARPPGGGQVRSPVAEPCPAKSGAWNV